ncbi:hypothetical protein DL93DRAFT_2151694 [Clavulina sp. PMI_390]|nr:hypothetical protein DL93DRAFT_2151694 [Clavulina sp. PMI_390]
MPPKRKRVVEDEDFAVPAKAPAAKRSRKKKAAATSDDGDDRGEGSSQLAPEKRLARIRVSPPQAIRERADRVFTQRFFLVDRQRNGEELREVFKVLGSTGNVYQVTINKLSSCDCPDARKGNQCKHILFVFLKVLGVPTASSLWYQKALLTSELENIFSTARPNPSVLASESVMEAYSKATGSPSKGKAKAAGSSSSSAVAKHKKPDDACAICYEEMEGEMEELEKILVWCDTCSKAIHNECFGQWSNTARKSGQQVTCVYCRSPWPEASTANTIASASTSKGGYLNLMGNQIKRDTSSYYQGNGSWYYNRRAEYYDYED